MLQEPASVRFLHVAMLQHDPEGRIAFMHRTAEGKFFPNRCRPHSYKPPGSLLTDAVHLLTLSESQAKEFVRIRVRCSIGGIFLHMFQSPIAQPAST